MWIWNNEDLAPLFKWTDYHRLDTTITGYIDKCMSFRCIHWCQCGQEWKGITSPILGRKSDAQFVSRYVSTSHGLRSEQNSPEQMSLRGETITIGRRLPMKISMDKWIDQEWNRPCRNSHNPINREREWSKLNISAEWIIDDRLAKSDRVNCIMNDQW